MRLLKDIGTLLRLGGGYFLNRRHPLSVTFLATYRCNFRCRYCSVWERDVPELTTAQALDMIKQLSRLGLRRLGFNGGEPLLREDIAELINYSRAKGITTTLFTNGWLVKESISKIKNLNLLLLSFDGPKDAHDAQRQAGSYDRVLEAIEAARSAGLNVWTNTVISKNNVGYIGFILNKAKAMGFKTTFQPAHFYPHSSNQEDIAGLLAPRKEYLAALDMLINEKKCGGPVVHSLRYLEYIKNPDWRSNKRRCWAGRFYFAVTPDGRVAPCYPIFASYDWPSGRDSGYKQAIYSLGRYSCGGCYCILAENDFFFSLKPDVVLNYLREIK